MSARSSYKANFSVYLDRLSNLLCEVLCSIQAAPQDHGFEPFLGRSACLPPALFPLLISPQSPSPSYLFLKNFVLVMDEILDHMQYETVHIHVCQLGHWRWPLQPSCTGSSVVRNHHSEPTPGASSNDLLTHHIAATRLRATKTRQISHCHHFLIPDLHCRCTCKDSN